MKGLLGCIHLLRSGLGDAEQKSIAIGNAIAVLVQLLVGFRLQRKALRSVIVIAFVAACIHEECPGRHVVCADENLPVLAFSAYKSRACCRHGKHHVCLSLYLFFCKNTRIYNTFRQLYRAGFLRGRRVFGVAGCVVDGCTDPRCVTLAVRPPHIVEFIAVPQHFNSGIQGKRFRCAAGAERFTGSAVAERCGTDVIHAVAVIRRDLHIAQRRPHRCLRCAEIHIRCEIALVERSTHGRDKFVECHAGIAAHGHAVHVHI